MAKIDIVLKRMFAWAVLISVLMAFVVGYLYFAAQQRQAEREIIYLKARQMAAQQQRERAQAYQKRLQEQRLRQQFNQGRVVRRLPAP